MWNIFKILNLITVLSSAYCWVTANIPVLFIMAVMDIAMFSCLLTLKIKFGFDRYIGRILLALTALLIWTVYNENIGMGMGFLVQYIPVFYLIALPHEYQLDLLKFVTKWLAVLLIPSLLIYWVTLFMNPAPLGTFVMEGYEPFYNYIFYIKDSFDYSLIIERFNAFFPEPGHLSMVCVFLMMANRFDFKKNPWMWVILTAVVFSFSLAGYLLTLIGFIMMKINSLTKGIVIASLIGIFVVGSINFAGGNNVINNLIIERLKFDQKKGIQGNNRFFDNTDFEFQKALKNGNYLTGVNGKTNMKLIGGAGFKIYLLWHGLIGAILVLALYLSLIPTKPNWHFTFAFLFMIILCFMQNAYPGWYAWIFPYVLGININSTFGLSKQLSDQSLLNSSYIY